MQFEASQMANGPRIPTFAERSDAEKIQLLRSEILELRRANQNLQAGIFTMNSQLLSLLKHEHGSNGGIMVPFGDPPSMATLNAKLGRSYDPLA